jgi:hypothetical protein
VPRTFQLNAAEEEFGWDRSGGDRYPLPSVRAPIFPALFLTCLLVLGGAAQLRAAERSEPDVTSADGWVQGTIDIKAEPALILRLVRDPFEIARVEGRGVEVSVLVTNEDGCSDLYLEVPSVVLRLRYQERSCLTEFGRHSILVESSDLKVYESEWWVEAFPGRTSATLRYRVRTIPSFPVPRALIERITKRSVRRMLAG